MDTKEQFDAQWRNLTALRTRRDRLANELAEAEHECRNTELVVANLFRKLATGEKQ